MQDDLVNESNQSPNAGESVTSHETRVSVEFIPFSSDLAVMIKNHQVTSWHPTSIWVGIFSTTFWGAFQTYLFNMTHLGNEKPSYYRGVTI